jgi:hypothetical protein
MSEKPISPLRRRMIEDMTVRNFVEKTRNVGRSVTPLNILCRSVSGRTLNVCYGSRSCENSRARRARRTSRRNSAS